MARKLSPRTLLHRLLATASRPVYVVDSQRTLVFCNAACSAWTGVSEQDLLGVRCDYHSVPGQDRAVEIAAALCPPPEVFQGQQRTAAIRLPGDDQQTPRQAHFLPLGRMTGNSGSSGNSMITGDDGGVVVWVAGLVEASFDAPGASPPWDADHLHECLRALRHNEGRRYDLAQLVGESASMVRVRDQVRLASRDAGRVLIVGPSGSGREHVARSIHQQRGEGDAPLIPLDCQLLDAELLETTIAAFVQRLAELKTGCHGTLLLLDVDRLASLEQARLFDMLAATELDLRTLATSTTRMDQLVRQREFRDDLACRLSTLTIELPALSDREEDIPLLAQWFLEAVNSEGGRQSSGFTADAMELLVAFDWPENVDELANVVAQACAVARGPAVQAEDLPERLRLAQRAAARPRHTAESIETIDMDQFLKQIESELIRRALRQAKGNKTLAAKLLGLNRARFHRRLTQLGLDT